MAEKLSWKEIEKRYDQEWVQLINYEWPEEDALPTAGVVPVHAKSRKEFDGLIAAELQKDSALLFIGVRKIPTDVVLSLNLPSLRNDIREGLENENKGRVSPFSGLKIKKKGRQRLAKSNKKVT